MLREKARIRTNETRKNSKRLADSLKMGTVKEYTASDHKHEPRKV